MVLMTLQGGEQVAIEAPCAAKVARRLREAVTQVHPDPTASEIASALKELPSDTDAKIVKQVTGETDTDDDHFYSNRFPQWISATIQERLGSRWSVRKIHRSDLEPCLRVGGKSYW